MYSLKSPNRDDSIEFTPHTLIKQKIDRISQNYRFLLPGLALWLFLSGSNYLYLKQISIVQRCLSHWSLTVFKKTNKPQRQRRYFGYVFDAQWRFRSAHSHRQIRIFTGRILDSQGWKVWVFLLYFVVVVVVCLFVFLCGQQRVWSDCADTQDDLSLRWAPKLLFRRSGPNNG